MSRYARFSKRRVASAMTSLAVALSLASGCSENDGAGAGGGNIDVNMLSRIIERGLVKDGRLVRFRVRIADHPGALHKLTGEIAAVRANIQEVIHNRAFSRVDLGETAVDVTLETRGVEHIEQLLKLLGERGYEHERLF